ncbi:MAG: hypothetical protein AB7R89_09170 [Dehalococcoidia bacterium]
MVERLVCTWSSAGLEGPGLGPYAATDALRAGGTIAWEGLRPLWTYHLNGRRIHQDTLPDDMPVTLALGRYNDQRCLVHRAYVGLDPYSRPGNYISQLLIGLPPDFTPHDASLLWDAPFWRDSVQGLTPGTPLPPLSADDLRQFGAQAPLIDATYARTQRALAYLIAAYLSKDNDQRVVIAAPPTLVAELIAGLSAALPPALLEDEDFTFSTYELDPNAANFSVVGTCPAPLTDPTTFAFQDEWKGHVWIDAYSNTRATIPPRGAAEEFAAFAVACLTESEWRPPERLIARPLAETADQRVWAPVPLSDAAPTDEPARTWSRADLHRCHQEAEERGADRAALLAAFRYFLRAEMLVPETLEVYLLPRRAAWLADPRVRRAILNAALANESDWWQRRAQPRLADLHRVVQFNADLADRATIVQAIRDLGSEAEELVRARAAADDVRGADLMVQVTLGCFPNRSTEVARRLLARVATHTAITPQLRRWALDLAARTDVAPNAQGMAPWLQGLGADAPALLSDTGIRLSSAWATEVIKRGIESATLRERSTIAEVVRKYESEASRALRAIASQYGYEQRAGEFAGELLAAHPNDAAALTLVYETAVALDTEHAGSPGARALLDQIAAAPIAGATLDRLLERHTDLLWHSGGRTFEQMLYGYFSRLTWSRFKQSPARGLVDTTMNAPGLSPEIKAHARAWNTLALLSSTRDPDALDWTQLMLALDRLNATQREDTARSEVEHLAANVRNPRTFQSMIDAFARTPSSPLHQIVLDRMVVGALTTDPPHREVAPELAQRLPSVTQSFREQLRSEGYISTLVTLLDDEASFVCVLHTYAQHGDVNYYRAMAELYDLHAERPGGPSSQITKEVRLRSGGDRTRDKIAKQLYERCSAPPAAKGRSKDAQRAGKGDALSLQYLTDGLSRLPFGGRRGNNGPTRGKGDEQRR